MNKKSKIIMMLGTLLLVESITPWNISAVSSNQETQKISSELNPSNLEKPLDKTMSSNDQVLKNDNEETQIEPNKENKNQQSTDSDKETKKQESTDTTVRDTDTTTDKDGKEPLSTKENDSVGNSNEEESEASIEPDSSEELISLEGEPRGIGNKIVPYEITNGEQFINSITKAVDGSTVHIKLKNDIHITNTINKTFQANVDIEGGNHAITYGGSPTGHGLKTGKDGLSIVMKNLKIGTEEKPKSTYYSLFEVTNKNVSLSVENITYYAEEGAQPFYASNGNNKLSISGTNSFISNGKKGNSQEFSEGFNIIQFAEGSQTTIKQLTTGSESVFWLKTASGIYKQPTITVGKDATVTIDSQKECLFYTNIEDVIKIKLAENAKFYFKRVSGGSSKNDLVHNKSENVQIDMENSSELKFTSEDLPLKFSTGTDLIINAKEVQSALFDNSSKNAALDLRGSKIQIKNVGNNIYQAIQDKNIDEVSGDDTWSCRTGDPIAKLEYIPAVIVGGVSAQGESGNDESLDTPFSRITARLTNVSSALSSSKYTYRPQYYLSKNPDSNQIDTSIQIDEKHHDQGFFQGKTINIGSTPNNTSKTNANNLFYGKDYQVFGRIAIRNRSTGVTSYTAWQVSKKVEVPLYRAIEVPVTFELHPQLVDSKELWGTYDITNRSNAMVDVSLSNLTANASQVEIVPSLDQTINTKKLQLSMGQKILNSRYINLGAMTKEEPYISNLQPYWDTTNSSSEMTFIGKYNGPTHTKNPASLNYNITLNFKEK